MSDTAKIKNENDYPTCKYTYVTLCIYPKKLDPTEVTARLGIQPSRWQRCGEEKSRGSKSYPVKLHGWFLTSKDKIQSCDASVHLNWLIDQLISKSDTIHSLQSEACEMTVTCYWCSAGGCGGPELEPTLMRKLADLNLSLWFDVYFN